MGVSIYYTAWRQAPLTQAERTEVDRVVGAFSVDREIEQYVPGSGAPNWESFAFYNQSFEPGAILEGSCRLPDISEEILFQGARRWAKALAAIRRAVPGCKWRVAIEDHELAWDEERQEYDIYA